MAAKRRREEDDLLELAPHAKRMPGRVIRVLDPINQGIDGLKRSKRLQRVADLSRQFTVQGFTHFGNVVFRDLPCVFSLEHNSYLSYYQCAEGHVILTVVDKDYTNGLTPELEFHAFDWVKSLELGFTFRLVIRHKETREVVADRGLYGFQRNGARFGIVSLPDLPERDMLYLSPLLYVKNGYIHVEQGETKLRPTDMSICSQYPCTICICDPTQGVVTATIEQRQWTFTRERFMDLPGITSFHPSWTSNTMQHTHFAIQKGELVFWHGKSHDFKEWVHRRWSRELLGQLDSYFHVPHPDGVLFTKVRAVEWNGCLLVDSLHRTWIWGPNLHANEPQLLGGDFVDSNLDYCTVPGTELVLM